MDLDLDDIDDAPKKVRVGARFQPKAKPRPPKKSTPMVPSSQQAVINEQSHEAQKHSHPDDQSNSGVEKHSYPGDQSSSGVEKHSDDQSNSRVEKHSCLDDQSFSGVEKHSADQSNSGVEKHSADQSNYGVEKHSDDQSNSGVEKHSYLDDQCNSGVEKHSDDQSNYGVEQHSYLDDQSNSGVVNPSLEQGVSICNTNSMVDSGPDIDLPIPEKPEDLQVLFERSTGEDTDIMIELDSLDFLHDSSSVLDNAASNVPSDPVIQSVDDSGSLFHIPNVDSESQISVAEDLLTENEFIVVDPVHKEQDMQSVPSVGGIVNEVSMDDKIPDLNDETLEEHILTGPKAPKKLAARRAKKTKEGKTTASDQSSNPHGASSTTSNQTGTSSRVLRKRQNRDSSFQLVDEPEDDNDAPVDEKVGSDSEFQPTNKPPEEKQKPGRKRKKDNKKTDETVKEAPKKKFSHSTRRRKVDKSLLENPDNIDRQKVSLTNLIRLAEHKERAAKKNVANASSQAPPPNQSTVNHHPARDNGFQDNDEDLGEDFGDHIYFNEEQIQEDTGLFNYQTLMNKTRTAKWTEQDTELFYEGIQQFGTDFTMIQQLFPGRTRRQVKLKYKKEELKHPLRIRDAIMNRSKGHFHFDTVIERLKQEKKNNENDYDSLNGEGGEDESEAKNEVEEVVAAEQAQDDQGQDVVDKEDAVDNEEEPVDEATATEQADDSEDELLRWSQYTSEP